MLPKWHILYGALFTLLLALVAPTIPVFNLLLVFLASFLIDFDHYLAGAMKNKSWSISKSLHHNYSLMYKQMADAQRGIKKRGDFHLFHTVEFHILVGIFGIFFAPFFYIFIGMVFHSLLDLYDLMSRDQMHVREYFFFKWARRNFA